MIQHVNTVLVGKTLPAAYTNIDALVAGDVALFDQDYKLLKTDAEAAAAKEVYIGVAKAKVNVTLPDGTVAPKANIEYSNKISKDLMLNYVTKAYAAPVQDAITVTLTSATIKVGTRYVLRIVYKDIYEAPGQFTHTYEVYATSTTPADLAAAFAKRINKHANRRVNATVAAAVLTLTAMEKDDSEGLNSMTEYSTVSMEATLYSTDVATLFGNYPTQVAGAVIAKTQGNPGSGYWKQVRDLEVRNMGYKGHVFTGTHPEVEQDLNVEMNATYDCLTVENDNTYVSNDNRYIKNTPIGTIVYFKHVSDLAASVFVKAFAAFVAGKTA